MNSEQYDKYMACWILRKLGWSYRRIAKSKMPSSSNAIKNYILRAENLINSDEMIISKREKRKVRIIPFGGSSELENLNTHFIHNSF